MESTVQRDPSFPGPHPEPPDDLSHRTLPVRTITQPWFRIHTMTHDPLYFGTRGTNRFDAPDRTFGVLYAAEDAHCAFVEVFGQPTPVRILDRAALAHRGLAVLRTLRLLILVDRSGEGLARIGADARLIAGEHAIAQRWSWSIYHHAEQLDGIICRARHDPSRRSVAIFDRAAAFIELESSASLLDAANAVMLGRILDHYGYNADQS
jgi:hypothetical protein